MHKQFLTGTWVLWLLGCLFARCLEAQEGEFCLRNDLVEFRISLKTGQILGACHAERLQEFLDICCDKYVLQNEQTEVTATEADDIVTHFARTESPASLGISLTCTNRGLSDIGITVTKTYFVPRKEPYLIKETALHATDRGFFLSAWVNVGVSPSFRKGAYYYVPYPHSVPWRSAEEVSNDTPVLSFVYGPLQTCAVALVNLEERLGAASYLYRTNGAYTFWSFPVLPSTDEELKLPIGERVKIWRTFSPTLTPAGWRHYVHRDYLAPHSMSSYTVHYTTFRGDSAAFLKHYISLPHRRELASRYVPPSWLCRVKLSMFNYPHWRQMLSEDFLPKFKSMVDSLGGGVLMPILGYYAFCAGDYPTDGEDQRYMKTQIGKLHALSSDIRIGAYTIPVLDSRKSKTYAMHKNWAVTNLDGTSPVADFPGRYPIQVKVPECREYHAASLPAIVRPLALDFLYVDEAIRAFGPNDWGNRAVSHYGDWYILYRQILDNLREIGPEVALFRNGPMSLLADCSFVELGRGQWLREDWRGLSDSLYFAKLYQREGTWVSHLYPFDLKRYFSYMLALALKPNFAPKTDEDFDRFYRCWVPYVNCAYEMKDAKLFEAHVSPSWRREKTSSDVFALRQGNSFLITAVLHADHETEQEISFDTGPMGLKGGCVLMCEAEMNDPDKIAPGETAVKINRYHCLQVAEQMKLNVVLRPYLVKLLSFSTAPAFVHTVDGKGAQLRLADTESTCISCAYGADPYGPDLRVATNRPCRIMIPADQPGVVLEVDGKPAAYETFREGGVAFALVDLPIGRHLVRKRPK